MASRARLAVLAGAVILAAVLAWLYLASPERRLLRRLDALDEALDRRGAESQLVAAATARQVAGFFAPGFFVGADPYAGQITGERELMAAVMQLRGAAERVEVSFTDREVRLDPGAANAVVAFTATATLDRGAGPARERWRVRSLWVEDEGDWRIAELVLVDQLESGGLLLP